MYISGICVVRLLAIESPLFTGVIGTFRMLWFALSYVSWIYDWWFMHGRVVPLFIRRNIEVKFILINTINSRIELDMCIFFKFYYEIWIIRVWWSLKLFKNSVIKHFKCSVMFSSGIWTFHFDDVKIHRIVSVWSNAE